MIFFCDSCVLITNETQWNGLLNATKIEYPTRHRNSDCLLFTIPTQFLQLATIMLLWLCYEIKTRRSCEIHSSNFTWTRNNGQKRVFLSARYFMTHSNTVWCTLYYILHALISFINLTLMSKAGIFYFNLWKNFEKGR